MFSKCANPEDGGGVKRIIMGLDRNTRHANLRYSSLWSVVPDIGHFSFIQDTMRILFRGVLHARRSTCEHAIHIRHQTGRANNPLRLGSWIQGRQAVRTRQKWWPGALFLNTVFFQSHALNGAILEVRDEHRQDYDPGRGGWGAQAQKSESERRRQEVEERYADVEQGAPVAVGGGEWKQSLAPSVQSTLKRARSPEDEDDSSRQRARVDEDTGRM